jgi:hypothetical protein
MWATKFGYAVEAPNYKHQITNKFQLPTVQIPNIGKRFGHLKLRFWIYLGFVICYLEFVIGSGYTGLGMFVDVL